jgi:hypothetical protein
MGERRAPPRLPAGARRGKHRRGCAHHHRRSPWPGRVSGGSSSLRPGFPTRADLWSTFGCEKNIGSPTNMFGRLVVAVVVVGILLLVLSLRFALPCGARASSSPIRARGDTASPAWDGGWLSERRSRRYRREPERGGARRGGAPRRRDGFFPSTGTHGRGSCRRSAVSFDVSYDAGEGHIVRDSRVRKRFPVMSKFFSSCGQPRSAGLRRQEQTARAIMITVLNSRPLVGRHRFQGSPQP